MKKQTIIQTFKGFDKDLKCRDFQYKEGETYETKDKPIRCTEHGFHSCENPIDIFNYYSPATSRFHQTEASGQIDKCNDDTKIASSKIKIGIEISLKSLTESAIKFIFKKCDWSKKENHATGYKSASSATGDNSASSATGYKSASLTTGIESESSLIGKCSNSIAIGFGINNKAKAPLNCWITLAEWHQDKDYNWQLILVKSIKVDGKKIKEDTWYKLENKKFIEVK